MAKDIRRVRRVAHLLQTMESVARKQVGDANRAVSDLQDEHRRLLESLSGDHELTGAFVDLFAKRANAIARALDVKLDEQTAATVAWRQARIKSNAARDAVSEAEVARDNLRAAKELDQLIEDSQKLGRARSR